MPMHRAGETLKNNVLNKGATMPSLFLALVNQQFTATASSDTLTATNGSASVNHNLAVGDRVIIGPVTTGAAGLTAGATYFVQAIPSASTFKLAATSGGTAITVTTAGSGAWISREQGSMSVVNETASPGSGGYTRAAYAPADWTDDNLTQTDSRFSAVEKSFGPFSSTVTITHVVRCTTATGAGVLYDSSALSIVQPIGSGAYYRNTARNTES